MQLTHFTLFFEWEKIALDSLDCILFWVRAVRLANENWVPTLIHVTDQSRFSIYFVLSVVNLIVIMDKFFMSIEMKTLFKVEVLLRFYQSSEIRMVI